MANIFDNVSNRLQDDKITPRSQESREWFLDKVDTIARGLSRDKLMSKDPLKPVASVYPGMMYMFYYSPATAKSLPYYDSFPLVILVDMDKDGMTGLNLHYLPINLRQKLFYGLLNRVSSKELDDKTYIKLTYDYLQNARSLKEYRPCYKKYLTSQIRGSIAKVPANEWETAVHLPLALFRKESEDTVHRRSEQMIQRF
jgi:hypothetical protein